MTARVQFWTPVSDPAVQGEAWDLRVPDAGPLAPRMRVWPIDGQVVLGPGGINLGRHPDPFRWAEREAHRRAASQRAQALEALADAEAVLDVIRP